MMLLGQVDFSWYSGFNQLGFWPCIVLIVGVSVLGSTLSSVAIQWRKAQQAGFEAGLKAQMIERGMSVDEIERVLALGDDSRKKRRR